jgi:small-conductance mechanosensitive channel
MASENTEGPAEGVAAPSDEVKQKSGEAWKAVGNLLRNDPHALSELLSRTTRETLSGAFADAKGISDFVGMIIRLAFCLYATLFFWSQISNSNIASLRFWVLGVSALSMSAILLAFALLIAVSIYFFLLRIMSRKRSIQIWAITIIVAMLVSLTFFYGIFELIFSLPRPS